MNDESRLAATPDSSPRSIRHSVNGVGEEDGRVRPGMCRDHRPGPGRRPARPHTQRERVLAALRRTGNDGLTQVDFLAPGVVDGGAPITRLASRIDELRSRGHHIEHAGRRNRCVVDRLVDEPAGAARRDDRAALAGRDPQLGLDDDHAALFSAAVGARAPRSPYAMEIT